MGGINKVALDRLSFVIEMTKDIKEKADIDRKLESQHFVWLLRDFYMKYMELALRNVKGDEKDVSTKNEEEPRPEFMKDLYSLKKFVFKQVEDQVIVTTMIGSNFVRVVQCFLDIIDDNVVPIIKFS